MRLGYRLAVIAQAPFLFSMAGLSLSLAGLAGLVAGLRRGADLPPIEWFRLREIVEFSFATALLSLSVFPLAELAGDAAVGLRLVGALGVAYMVVVIAFLEARRRRHGIRLRDSPGWVAIALGLDAAIIVAAVMTLATGSTGTAELMFLALLARPMAAFLLVLAGLGERRTPPIQ
jgi:hypothetical protein